MELIIDSMFGILGTSFSRFIIEQIPPATVGKVFEKSRNVWKRSTKKIKKSQLNTGDE
jgi:hypothetical protein